MDKIDDFEWNAVQWYEGSFKSLNYNSSEHKKIQSYISTTGFTDKRKGNF